MTKQQYTLEDIEAIAQSLREYTEQEGCIPVDPYKVAKYLKIKVVPRKTKDETSLGHFNYRMHKIVVADDSLPFERRCTVAHELGHAVLHPMGRNILSPDDKEYKKRKEEEAEMFVGALLMPPTEFKIIWEFVGRNAGGYGGSVYTEDMLKRIAPYFEVCGESVENRKWDLGLV